MCIGISSYGQHSAMCIASRASNLCCSTLQSHGVVQKLRLVGLSLEAIAEVIMQAKTPIKPKWTTLLTKLFKY